MEPQLPSVSLGKLGFLGEELQPKSRDKFSGLQAPQRGDLVQDPLCRQNLVNILVAASRQDHPHHTPALQWLQDALADSAQGRSLAILPMVASGFLRLVTFDKGFRKLLKPSMVTVLKT